MVQIKIVKIPLIEASKNGLKAIITNGFHGVSITKANQKIADLLLTPGYITDRLCE